MVRWLGLLALSFFFSVLPFAASALADSRPNIVLIMADDVGADAIGCYGGSSFPTPNIDRLANSGMRFEHCYSMPSCHPTRVCLLTGKYPRRIDNPKWGSFPKALESQTVGALLRNAGYATAVVGKWQLTLLGNDGRQPNRMGFDTYSLFGWHEGPRYYEPLIWQDGKPRNDVREQYGPDVYSDVLIEFMKQHSRAPFFAYFPMALCHDVTDDLNAPTPYGPKGRYDSFAEMMQHMDRVVGKVVVAIEKMNLKRRTVVLFTGDNGTAMRSIIRYENGKYIRDPVFTTFKGQRIQGGKTKLTDGGTHVPLIAHWIGEPSKKKTNAALVDFSDFLPTLCELAGAAPPQGMRLDGVSFAGELTESEKSKRTFAYSEARGRYFVRDQRWKLYNDNRFYDVANDRAEQSALSTSQLNDVAKAARAKLAAALKQVSEIGDY